MKQKLAIYLTRFRQLKTSEQRLLLALSAFLSWLLGLRIDLAAGSSVSS